MIIKNHKLVYLQILKIIKKQKRQQSLIWITSEKFNLFKLLKILITQLEYLGRTDLKQEFFKELNENSSITNYNIVVLIFIIYFEIFIYQK